MTDLDQSGLRPPMTTEDQRSMILNILVDMVSDDLGGYIRHVGFDIQGLDDPKNFVDAWLGHYRLGQGIYDVDRALMDLCIWPPISRRIFELQEEQRRLAK